ncbi:winged helix-turn-helix domain-containing protein [Citrobacter amalonaticus]|uniref:winged helix-turn-helix domain-containing protein n=1 Tax=Citrobacter amalonaticus TaxID=35703 RepID=UPI00300C8E47
MPEKYPHTTIYTINNLVDFHPSDRTLKNKITEKSVILQNPASFILLYLITNCGVVIPQARLVEAGWGEKNNITSINTLYQTVLMLRNALTEVGLPRDLIRTVARRGMVITADIQRVETNTVNEIEKEPEARDDMAQTRPKTRFSRKMLMAGMLVLSILLIGAGASFGLFYPTAESLFSAYTIIDATSFSSCTILLKGQKTLNKHYAVFLTRHKTICQNNNYVFLSGMSSAKNIAAVACQLDIRKNPSTKCTTWYSINDKN